MALRKPDTYAKFVIDLFTLGKARVNKLSIVASAYLRKASIIGGADPADWIAFASLRNSENYISWGNIYNIPVRASKPLEKRDFLNKFYGFVSGRL